MSEAYVSTMVWSSGSSGRRPSARSHTFCRGWRACPCSARLGQSTWRMSMGRGRSCHGVSVTPDRVSRSRMVGSSSGGGTSGIGKAWSNPSSAAWKLAARLKIALPCWMAVTRRVVNDPPSRRRSTE
jgi:hypothetical protein